MIQEFKDFIAKGNVMDMAVGIIIGAAFTAIVGSLVADLINPIISLFMGGVDFSGLHVVLGSGDYGSIAEAEDAGAAVFAYGRFIMAVINFLIVAWVVFILVKLVNKAKNPKEEAPAADSTADSAADSAPSELDVLLEIRDALAKKK
ncbi:Large-conductance mechanosensitive channel [hydrothermal vent metagenome]|uniref:Large-conductance mechanosensitive channel n=1 Tax=hydrothermal vent metagenome TaxID=652676 RepID=A0A3B0RLQ6_9ZZZZ